VATQKKKPGVPKRRSSNVRLRNSPTLSLDPTYMMEDSIGSEAGLTAGDLYHELEAAQEARADMLAGRGPGVDRLGWIDLPAFWRAPEGNHELERMHTVARRLRRLGHRHLILGIGGS